jgi:hypothetical protein
MALSAVGPPQGAHDAAHGRPKPLRGQLPTRAPFGGSAAAESRSKVASVGLYEYL